MNIVAYLLNKIVRRDFLKFSKFTITYSVVKYSVDVDIRYADSIISGNIEVPYLGKPMDYMEMLEIENRLVDSAVIKIVDKMVSIEKEINDEIKIHENISSRKLNFIAMKHVILRLYSELDKDDKLVLENFDELSSIYESRNSISGIGNYNEFDFTDHPLKDYIASKK